MRVCLVSDPYHPYPSGVSEYTRHLARHLRRRGHDVTILTTHYPGEQAEDGVVRVGRVMFIPMNKSFATMSTGLEIPRRVKDLLWAGRYDVVHTNGPFPPSISFFALHYSRSVNITTFHSTGFGYHRRGAACFQRVFRHYREKLSAMIAVSTTARDTFLPYFPGDFRIIPNGVDTDMFSTNVMPRQDLPSGSPRILYVGRLDLRKGVMELIRAMPRVMEELPDARLVVVGKGPLQDQSRAVVRDLGLSGSVFFAGFVSSQDLPSYYASCDVYCSPALGGESFGIVLLEAMATGKPVVASRIPGYDQVIVDGVNGLFFDPRDPRSIARAIIRVARETGLRESLVRGGLASATELSWTNIARKTEELYVEKVRLNPRRRSRVIFS